MITYLFTSTSFAGHIVFCFDEKTGLLLKYDVTTAELNEEQMIWISTRSPRTIPELEAVVKKTQGGKIALQKKLCRKRKF